MSDVNSKGTRTGLTDAEAADLLRIPPAMVYDARHGRTSIAFVLASDGLWHDAGEALRAYRAGTYSRGAVEAAVNRGDAEADAPSRKANADAEAAEQRRQGAQRAENRKHWSRAEAHRAAEEKKHAEAIEAATGLKRA